MGKHEHHHVKDRHKKTTITTGPFLVPEETGPDFQLGRNNDRLVITLKNPTNKKLKAAVKLGICRQPEFVVGSPWTEGESAQVRTFKNIHEKEVNLGKHALKPHTCTRIERDIPGGALDLIADGDERNAVYRVTATGDFKTCKKSCEPVCGKLEISVVAGSTFNPEQPGLEQGDPVTFFRYKDFVLCEKEKHKDD
ncbi:MAG: hypothetical protein ACO1OC_02120 [Tuberibacillus sp.]